MNEDLVIALENALARGSSLESAKKSLINAGYPSAAVEEASHFVHSGVLSMTQRAQQPVVQRAQPMTQREQPMMQRAPQVFQPNTYQSQRQEIYMPRGVMHRNKNIKILVLMLILVALLACLALVILNKDYINQLLTNWFDVLSSIF